MRALGRLGRAAHNELLPGGAGRYLGIEAAASVLRSYSTQTIPAVAQTADYAAAVCQATRPELSAGQIHNLVAITVRRQEILHHRGVRLHLIIDESAVLRMIAPVHVMTAQLDHLRTLAASTSTTMQIAALATPLPVLSPPFTVLSFPDATDADVTITYGPGDEAIISTNASDAHAMLLTFNTLAQTSLSPADSTSMIGHLIGKVR